MLRRIAALLLVSALAGPLGAEPDAPLDLTGARILASPGWPQALRAFLPPGKEVEPLALPLPPGPVLVLGLFGRDPVAREVGATTFGMKADEDLGGGYAVVAKRDGDRPIVAILAADAAALMAARFELETFVPAGKEKEPRSVEVEKPDEQAGVRTAPGRRQVKPRFRIRAAAGLGPGESVLDIAAAHANRFWVNDRTTDRELAQLRDHGVEPVVVSRLDATMPRELLLAWQKRGIRHFVADLRGAPTRKSPQDPPDPSEALVVKQMAEALRPGGLDEILVLPAALDDATAEWAPTIVTGNEHLRSVGEAVVGWAGPWRQPLEITREQAEKRAHKAGVPVVLIETWMEAAGGEPLRIPSLPRGRDADLGDVLAGVVVLPGPASADALAAAWLLSTDPDASPELGDLMGACVLNAKDGPTFLIESAACLEQMLLGRYADSPWMRALPQQMRESAAALGPADATLLARWTGDKVKVDGRLDEACWGSAPAQEFGIPQQNVQLRAISDGHRLVVGVRIPNKAHVTGCVLKFRAEGGEPAWEVSLPAPSTEHKHPSGVTVAEARGEAAVEYEVALEHYPLRGDPYPTRRFAFSAVASAGSAGKTSVAFFPAIDAKDLLDAPDSPPRGALLVIR